MIESFAKSIAKIFYKIEKTMAKRIRTIAPDYCPIVGVPDNHTFSSDANTLISVIRLSGTTTILGENEVASIQASVLDLLKPTLREANSSIQFVFQKDPSQLRERISKAHEAMRAKFKSVDLDADGVVADRVDALVKQATYSDIWICIYTAPFGIVDAKQSATIKSRMLDDLGPDFSLDHDGLRYYIEPRQVSVKHKSIVDSVLAEFNKMNLKVTLLEKQEVFETMGNCLDSAYNKKTLRDQDTPLHHRYVNGGFDSDEDPDDFIWPSIGEQLFSNMYIQPNRVANDLAKINERYVGAVSVTASPYPAKNFDTLLMNLTREEQPFRISIWLHGGNDYFVSRTQTKKFMAIASRFTSGFGNGAKVQRAADNLLDKSKNGPLCGATIVATTWADNEELAREYLTDMSVAVSKWGEPVEEKEFGDPMLLYTSTIPGWAENFRQPVEMYLADAVKLIPLKKFVSMWENGVMMFLNEHHEPCQFSLMSEIMLAWSLGISSPSGGGKSVLLQRIILDLIGDPSVPGMPKGVYVDVGRSAKNLIMLLRSIATKNPDRFRYTELKADTYINVLDTRLMMNSPTSAERGVITAMLGLVFTDAATGTVVPGMDKLIAQIQNELYQYFQFKDPKRYDLSIYPEVREYLDKNPDFEVDKHTTWYQVRDYLFSKKQYKLATYAQMRAVPTIGDIPTLLEKSPDIKDLYKDSSGIISEARRCVLSFIANFPSLCGPSREIYESGDITVIDVTSLTRDKSPIGKIKSCVAYNIARYIAKDFLVNEEILAELSPEALRYYGDEIRALSIKPKFMIYDEFHTTDGVGAVQAMVEDDMRNTRKYKAIVGVASQKFSDFKALKEQLYMRFFLRVETNEEAAAIAESYSWNEATKLALKKKVFGAPYMMLYTTGFNVQKTNGVDSFCQVLQNIMSPSELVALNTDRECLALKYHANQNGIPYWDASRIIADLFPKGVAKALQKDILDNLQSEFVSDEEEDRKEAALKDALRPLIKQVITTYVREVSANGRIAA